MNRRDRRASQAQANKSPHPTQSFSELVGQTSLDRLKPFIHETVQVMGAQLARQQLSSQANVLTRLSVLEKLMKEKLGETDESLASRVAQSEDEALSLVQSLEAAKQGDTVRISFRGYEEGGKPEGDFTRSVLRRLKVEPVQFNLEIETAVVGMQTGETKTVTLDTGSTKDATTGELKKNPNMFFEIRVDRISIPKEKPPLPELNSGDGHEHT